MIRKVSDDEGKDFLNGGNFMKRNFFNVAFVTRQILGVVGS